MPAYVRSYHRRSNETLKAALFGVFVMTFFVGTIVMALCSGPIVLGTEMNTNGLVEYLCLGTGCENLQDMDW